jgi:tryptophanyl-tRNA synthetase
MDKKIIFSGIQPSGDLTLGNYIGAIKNWVKLQEEYNCYYCVVDLHAITVRQNPTDLRKRTLDVLALYLACGIDPEKNVLFIQSHVPAHSELAWLLNCNIYMGELSRMTQFKDKSSRQGESINVGLFAYPSLMAADILLYQTDLVPVGDDQKQHLELSRDVAQRFNHAYSDTFVVPEPYISKEGARIMGLQDPSSKMSKSGENANDYILLLDDLKMVEKKIKRSVTDSLGIIAYNNEQLGIKNLLNIYKELSGKDIETIVAEYEGKGYGIFKSDLADLVVSTLKPLQEEFNRIRKDKAYLESIYIKGAETAERQAQRTLRKVKKKIGFIPR